MFQVHCSFICQFGLLLKKIFTLLPWIWKYFSCLSMLDLYMWCALDNGMLVIVGQATAWNVLVQLGLPSCTSAAAMRRASEQFCSISLGSRLPTCRGDLSPGCSEEVDPASPPAWIRVKSWSTNIWAKINNYNFKPLNLRVGFIA